MPHALSPLPKNRFGYSEAEHLLARAGFGGTPEQILTLADMGCEDAVDSLLEWERVPDPGTDGSQFRSDIMTPLTRSQREKRQRARRSGDEAVLEEFREARQARQREDRRQMRDIQSWWLERLIETPRPLQEKLTLFWHGHFATGYRAVEDSWHMMLQNNFLRQNAGGNFRDDLVHGIIRDPAMIKYLNNNQNTRKAPNENLARELMELFTLGEGAGYTEDDIKEGARALTGMTYRDDTFAFNQRNHDSSGKRLFGRSGQFDGDDFVELIFQRPAISWFVPWKIHRFFVNDAIDVDSDTKRAVSRMGRTFRSRSWEVRPMLRELLCSSWFYDDRHRRTLIKSPVQLTVQAIRSLGTPARNINRLNQACGVMGQELFQPPSVKGWEAGRKWINTSTLFVRENTLVYLMTGRDPASRAWEASRGGWSAEPLVAHLRGLADRDEVVDVVTYLSRLLLGSPPTDGSLERWIAFARNRDSLDNETLTHLLSLMTAAPEYQLC
ncbi:MAG: DUF1800 domain-containing protein [Phycisphaerales bacterium]|jgi:uncharacterized protein (DUF1800 family)|nr:DUF1800 domain-containing protein [Phycisphaerales bacterium]